MGFIDKLGLKLTVLTPLHIGHFEQKARQGIDFVYYSGTVYWINSDKLIHQLARVNKLDDFSVAVQDRTFDLADFLLTKLRLSGSALANLLGSSSAYSCASPQQIKGDYHPFIRDGYAEPYIPGSSIKGAIRSAAIYSFIKDNMKDSQWFETAVLSRVRRNLGIGGPARYGSRRYEVGDFLEDIASDFKLGDMASEQHTDLFRAIRVADTPLTQTDIGIAQVSIEGMSARAMQQASSRSPGLFVECIKSSEKAISIAVDIDFCLFKELATHPAYGQPSLGEYAMRGISNATDLLTRLLEFCHQFSADIKKSSKQPSPGGDNLFRLGWGTGVHSKGIMSLIYPHIGNRNLEQERIVKLYRNAGINTFPKTHKVAIAPDGKKQSLGWSRLEIAGAA
ncbi:MAG: type III-A CRISPR-associated RAMP protein Csm5 [Chloroflexi bacterium]|nr:type III-A CRISPR-associated RAMP protein Csm5 [Chloroflexota bacterium]